VRRDCTSSKTPAIQEANLRDMANVGAAILSAEDLLRELAF
jgi:hypothetical protein